MKGSSPFEKLTRGELDTLIAANHRAWREAWEMAGDINLPTSERHRWHKRGRTLGQTRRRLKAELERRQTIEAVKGS